VAAGRSASRNPNHFVAIRRVFSVNRGCRRAELLFLLGAGGLVEAAFAVLAKILGKSWEVFQGGRPYYI
jgi:hypothetical protein